jgi:uncharacterized protein (TIGR00106 family)
MPIMQISVVPIGTESPSVSRYVTDVIKVLKKEKDIKYELTSMATIVEADSLDRLFELAKKMHQVPFNKGALRVTTSINIDDRRDKPLSIKGKLDSVKRKLN